MPTMIFTYSPKPGVPFETFQKHVVEFDMPRVLTNPAVIAAVVYRLTPLELEVLTHGVAKQSMVDEYSPFSAIEVIHVRSFEEYLMHSRPTAERREQIENWGEVGDLETISAYRGEAFFQSCGGSVNTPTWVFTNRPMPSVAFEDSRRYMVEVDMPWNFENPALVAVTTYHVHPIAMDILSHGLVNQSRDLESHPFSVVEIMRVRSYEEFLKHNHPTKERIEEWSKFVDLNAGRGYYAEVVFQTSV